MIAASIVGVALGQALAPAPVLTLEQALAEARRQNLDIQQAEARLQQAKELSSKAWSGYLPQVTAGASYTRNELEARIPAAPPVFPTDVVIQKRDQLGAQAEVRQALIAPALWPAIANAYKAERVAELGTENARREVLFGVAQVYYGAAGAKQIVSVVERTLAVARDHEKDARVRYQAGTTPKVALLRAEIDRAQAEQDLKRAQNGFESAKVALATLLDHPGDFDVEVPPRPRPPAEEGLEQAALRDRPDVQAAAESLRLAEGARDAVYARYLPSLGAFGRYQWANSAGFAGKETTWALGLGINWSIFDGGLREADLRESRAKVVEVAAAKRSAEARALEEVRRARLDLDSALANRAKAAESVQLARENQSLVEVSYKAGAATYLEATDANQALRSAELGLVSESLNADLAALRLQKAVGAFTERRP